VGLLSIGMAVPALAQKSKDTLRFPVANPDGGLDDYTGPSNFSQVYSPSVFDQLLAFDPLKSQFVGHLAKSFSQPDATTYDFELRSDAKWHDGQPLTADDVVYTVDYLIDPKVTLRYKAFWAWIKSVEKVSPTKVRIIAKQWVPNGLMTLATRTPIYPKHLHGAVANKLDFATKPVGTGPLRIVQMDKNAGIVGEKYAGYIPIDLKPAAGYGRLVSEPIKDTGTITATLLTGQADVAVDLSPDQVEPLVESGRFDVTLAPPHVGLSFLGFPSKGWENVKALSDVRVRTAIIKAIDRQALVKVKYGELGAGLKPFDALCSKEQLGCGFTKPVPAYDPAGAKKLLAEAGYADGFDVSISCFPAYANEATAVAGMLRAIGIRASVRQHAAAQRVQLISQGKVEIGYYGWDGGAMFEVSGQLGRHVNSNEYDDPVLAKLAAPTYSIVADAERRKAVAKVFDHITENAYAFAMVPNRPTFVHTKEVRLNASRIRAGLINPHEFGWK
jgi:peptide/nickel transport system substrate-binding protein